MVAHMYIRDLQSLPPLPGIQQPDQVFWRNRIGRRWRREPAGWKITGNQSHDVSFRGWIAKSLVVTGLKFLVQADKTFAKIDAN